MPAIVSKVKEIMLEAVPSHSIEKRGNTRKYMLLELKFDTYLRCHVWTFWLLVASTIVWTKPP
jgi:hypothetical protein